MILNMDVDSAGSLTVNRSKIQSLWVEGDRVDCKLGHNVELDRYFLSSTHDLDWNHDLGH